MRTEKKRPGPMPERQPPKSVRRRSAASEREPAPNGTDQLARYRDQRDFSVTPEPRGHVRRTHGDNEAADITAREPRSVASGRLPEEIAGPDEAMWTSDRAARPAQTQLRPPEDRLSRTSRTSGMPQMLEPQLATLVDAPPLTDEWLYEIKFDGYRMLARIADGKVRIFTRNGQDWTERMPQVARALQELPAKQAWLDGEVAVPDAEGRTDFQLLQRALSTRESGIVYYLFDLLHVDGESLLTTPLQERKARLAKLLDAAQRSQPEVLQFSAHVEMEGRAVFEQACMHGMEGLIGKRPNATYTAGRSRTWIKLKCRQRQEFVIGGYTEPGGARTGLGALLLGVYSEVGRLQYTGKVGIGFNDERLSALIARLVPLAQRSAPFARPPRGADVRNAHWVQPKLVAEVSFTGWTADGLARHPSFEGLREDKAAETVTHEYAEPVDAPDYSTPRQAARKSSPTLMVAGIPISHAGRVIFPSIGLTKGDLASYYAAVADWILPHLRNRPLALVRCPGGVEAQCFFQKHPHEPLPAELQSIEIEESKGTGKYVVANSVEAVIRLVQLGVLEFHTWGTSVGTLERPDRVIFDLDPDPQLPWNRIVEGAHLTRALLQEIGLESFVKTTGGKGLHVAVPLARRHDWDAVKTFARAVAAHMEQVLPSQFTANVSKAQREGRIYMDYLRNTRGATAVAAYSTRARPGATVSMPLAWDEVAPNVTPDQFTVATVAQLLRSRQDPWAQYWNLHQSITPAMKEAIGIKGET